MNANKPWRVFSLSSFGEERAGGEELEISPAMSILSV